MGSDSRKDETGEGQECGPDTIERVMRERVRATIEQIVEEELEAALGAAPSARVGERCGYRHGTRSRTLTTSLGPTTIALPRARLRAADGAVTERGRRPAAPLRPATQRTDQAPADRWLAGNGEHEADGGEGRVTDNVLNNSSTAPDDFLPIDRHGHSDRRCVFFTPCRSRIAFCSRSISITRPSLPAP